MQRPKRVRPGPKPLAQHDLLAACSSPTAKGRKRGMYVSCATTGRSHHPKSCDPFWALQEKGGYWGAGSSASRGQLKRSVNFSTNKFWASLSRCSMIFLCTLRPASNLSSWVRRQCCRWLRNCKMVFLAPLLVRESPSWASPFTHLSSVLAFKAWLTAKVSSYPARLSRRPCKAERLRVIAS